MEDKQDSIWVVIISIALAAAAIVAWLNGWSLFPDPTQDDLSDYYELTEKEAKVVKIAGQPAVRSEPIVNSNEDFSNSFGNVRKNKFTVIVSKTYGTKKSIDSRNGAFIGLSVEEVLETAEGNEWFPHDIVNDPDGIVWINHEYIEVIL